MFIESKQAYLSFSIHDRINVKQAHIYSYRQFLNQHPNWFRTAVGTYKRLNFKTTA